jgi:hypothetical protein
MAHAPLIHQKKKRKKEKKKETNQTKQNNDKDKIKKPLFCLYAV